MAWIFIIIGIVLVGYYLVSDTDKPTPVPAKWGFALSGIAAIGLTIYLLYLIFYVSSGKESFFFFILSIGSLYAGVKLFQLAAKAEAQHATNIADRTRAKAGEIGFANAPRVAEETAKLESQKKKTETDVLKNQSRELDVRNTLAPVAEEQGLDVNSVIGINTHKYTQDIELQGYAKEKEIDFHFKARDKELELNAEQELIRQQLEAADRVEHYRIVSELEDKLEELLVKRRDIELNETDEVLKQQKVARLNKRITQLEADIDGRQDRLLSSSDGKETKRLT